MPEDILNLKSQIIDLMAIHYGFAKFRPGQDQAIDAVLAGRSSVIIMPTGGGKSLCYQLPALVLPGITIVISPLIALMKDQVDQLNNLGIPATFINSSISPAESAKRLDDLSEGRVKIVYIAPERFYDRAFVERLKTIQVSLFAIDEAHCISQWGHDFRPSYSKLARAIELVGKPPIIALTATATPEVRMDIIDQLNLDDPELVITGFARPNLQFGVIKSANNEKLNIINETIQSIAEPVGIIYAPTRNRTEEILQSLVDNGIEAVAYHAGMDARDRDSVQNDFMRGRINIIVATNAFGMGIDKSNIRFVIHDSLPPNIEAYYQEAGRAGRDGKPSVCLLLYSSRDRYLREFFIKGDNPSPEIILKIYELLRDHPNTDPQTGMIQVTYGELKSQLYDDVPEMAISTAVKILESSGCIRRSQEGNGLAYIKLISDWEKIQDVISSKAKKQLTIIANLQRNYHDKLSAGWQVNLDELAGMIGQKKATLQKLIKTLADQNLVFFQPPWQGSTIQILKDVPAEQLEINFDQLRQKLSAAYDKLDQIENYIFHDECRQKYILSYFGETGSDCGKCDVCLKPGGRSSQAVHHQVKHDSESPKAKKVLSTKLTQLETFDLYSRGLSVAEIAKTREIQDNTVVEHLCFLIEKKLPINIDKLVDLKKQQLIINCVTELGATKLKPIKEALGDDVSYNDIKLTLAKSGLYNRQR